MDVERMNQTDFKDWKWLDRTFRKPQSDVDGEEFGDIREFYKYFFFAEENEIFMTLSTAANEGQKFIVHLEVKEEYSLELKNKYQGKLEIREEKAKDLYSLRRYCETLTNQELDYQYPLPKNCADINEENEQLDEELERLQNKILGNNLEETWMTQMIANSQVLED